MIYFLQPIEGGPIKIGCSDDVEIRRRALESHYGRSLSLLATMEGDREKEREIHGRFAHLRFGRTEQFRPAADLLAFIGRPLLVSPNPDTIEAMDVATDLREAGIHIRGARVWTEWVGELADYRRKDISVVIDEALEEYAKRHKFGKIPPKRTQTKRDGKSLT